MKKYLLLLLVFVMTTRLMAQSTMMQRLMVPGKIDTLLLNYLNYSKFTSIDDVGFSDAVARQFTFLFIPDARISDEVNPAYFDREFDRPFDLPIRNVDDYIAKTKDNYPGGLFVKFNAIQVDYKNLSVTLLKETNGTTKNGLLYKITDTIKLRIKLSSDFKSVKIADIGITGYSIALANDDDRDFIPNGADKCPKEQGFRSGNGCFTKEEKTAFALAEKERKNKAKENDVAKNDKKEKEPKDVPDTKKDKEEDAKTELAKKEKKEADAAKAEAARVQKEKDALARKEEKERRKNEPQLPGLFVGIGFAAGTNNFVTTFEEGNFGYDKLIKNSKSVFNNTGLKQTKASPFTQAQIDLEYYFGAKKIIGIATGVGLSGFNATFGMDSFHVEYQAQDSRGRTFRRVSQVNTISEELKIQTLNIPILLQFKLGLGQKANLVIGAGLNFHNVSSTNVSAKATANYEAVYKFDAANNTVFDGEVTPDRSSWLITRNNVEAHHIGAEEKNYFESKRKDGYDVAIDQAISTTEKLNMESSAGILARVNLNFALSEKVWLSTLLQYQSVSFTNNSAVDGYTLTNAIGSYNALSRNVSLYKASSLAVGLGLKFTIK